MKGYTPNILASGLKEHHTNLMVIKHHANFDDVPQ